MLGELRDSMKKIMSERLVSPVLGSFTAAYLCLNWKLVLLVFAGDIETKDKIETISIVLSKEHHVIGPIIFSVLFVGIYPWLAAGGFYIWERAKKVKKDTFYKFENRTVLPIEKAVALREEYKRANERFLDLFKDKKEIEEKYIADLASSQASTSALNAKVTELETQLALYKSSKSFAEVISEEESAVLLAINESGDKGKVKALIGSETKIEYNRLLYVLQKLTEKQLIFQDRNDYYLSASGRKLVYENIFKKTAEIKLPGAT